MCEKPPRSSGSRGERYSGGDPAPLIPLLYSRGGLRPYGMFWAHSVVAKTGMSDGRAGDEASQASRRGDRTPLGNAGGGGGGEDLEACSCERIEGGEVLQDRLISVIPSCLMFDKAIAAPRIVFNRA